MTTSDTISQDIELFLCGARVGAGLDITDSSSQKHVGIIIDIERDMVKVEKSRVICGFFKNSVINLITP